MLLLLLLMLVVRDFCSLVGLQYIFVIFDIPVLKVVFTSGARTM